MKSRFFSLKWKLTLALIGSGCFLLLGYVFLAKSVFENDKIAYVYESQGVRLLTLAQSIRAQFDKSLLIARMAVENFDSSTGQFSEFSLKALREDQNLLGLEVLNEKNAVSVAHYEAKPGSLLTPADHEAAAPLGELKVEGLPGGRFLAWQRFQAGGENLRVRFVTDLSGLLPKADAEQFFALVNEREVLLNRVADIDLAPLLSALNFSDDVNLQTLPWEGGGQDFLVSSVNLGLAQLRLVALTPRDLALGALSTLLIRSLLFLVIAFCILVLISLYLARHLTASLADLTLAASRIGQGDFSSVPTLKSNDEMQVLSTAMNEMMGEIERLLEETHDKARMEAELHTASLVQEQLLPESSSFDKGEIQVRGLSISSSECGGDWWHYFSRGNEVYVAIADATGHGTPAALMTAAARSVFTRLEEENLALPEIMRAWNKSVFQCSKGKVCMTALLVQINIKNGRGRLINASHESPWTIRTREDHFEGKVLALEPSPPLGESPDFEAEEMSFELGPNESLVLFTDGLFSVEREDGKTLSERRFLKSLATRVEFKRQAQDVLNCAQMLFEEHREDFPLPDDVTLIAIRRQGPEISPMLETESSIKYL